MNPCSISSVRVRHHPPKCPETHLGSFWILAMALSRCRPWRVPCGTLQLRSHLSLHPPWDMSLKWEQNQGDPFILVLGSAPACETGPGHKRTTPCHPPCPGPATGLRAALLARNRAARNGDGVGKFPPARTHAFYRLIIHKRSCACINTRKHGHT